MILTFNYISSSDHNFSLMNHISKFELKEGKTSIRKESKIGQIGLTMLSVSRW